MKKGQGAMKRVGAAERIRELGEIRQVEEMVERSEEGRVGLGRGPLASTIFFLPETQVGFVVH